MIVLTKQIRLKKWWQCRAAFSVWLTKETHQPHSQMWAQTCKKVLFCDSHWGLGERKPLKYSCGSLQLEDYAPKLLRDAERSWRGLLHARSTFPTGGRAGASSTATTIPLGLYIVQVLHWYYQWDLQIYLKFWFFCSTNKDSKFSPIMRLFVGCG